MSETAKKPADYILPLYINGLSGRMLRMPPSKQKRREFLFVSGQHTSHERIFGVMQLINRYGAVTLPDLPGFGGMEPFYKIGEKPTLDNMADYLAAFIKLRFRNKKLSIIGFSYGFVVVTRMLQKYPEIVKKVDLLVSFAGMTNKNDFRLRRRTVWLLYALAFIISFRIPAFFARYTVLSGPLIRLGYKFFEPIFIKQEHTKVRQNQEEWRRLVDFEVGLWQNNDLRTWAVTSRDMFRLDLTGKHISLPVYHISINTDRYFNNLKVEENIRKIYKDFTLCEAKVSTHAPSLIATAKEARPYMPTVIRRMMNKKV